MLFGVFAALVFRRPFVLSDIGYLVLGAGRLDDDADPAGFGGGFGA